MDNISASHPLCLEGRQVRDELVAAGGDETLIRKFNDLLNLPFLHGGQEIKLRGLIAQARLK
ncbi:hypothetical protein NVV94_12125 [Pseudomonas sp. LS1212]|uniref:hypothetical protein n=1 Tax=Pseudomonas sp. LS1212 TaxID=2972478 RepID=UPI00215D1E69|nr:hypothetical protein [Pseudomonas sp. LS1212]UVJ46211.1 hypothetical protein NVV94_12125 [Pseudomonas sp. LS1212]